MTSDPWDVLLSYSAPLYTTLDRVVDDLTARAPLLARAVGTQLAVNRSPAVTCNRLFALAVCGSMSDQPIKALPVSVVSSLWWAGAEALDDMVDADGRALPAQLCGGVANLALLPLRYIDKLHVSQRRKRLWTQDVMWSTCSAAEGQLANTTGDAGEVRRKGALQGYFGKTGAAYARDAVMAARLNTDADERVEEWRQFGLLYGLLRQLHNDNAVVPAEEDQDLANGTPTLMLAHAFAVADPETRAELRSLRQEARTCVDARRRLRSLLRLEQVVSAYRTDVRGLHANACDRLDVLCGPGVYRDALRTGLDASARLALPEAVRG